MSTILKKLFNSVCRDLGVMPESAIMKCRKPELVIARQIYCYWAHDSEIFSLHTIANEINIDHSTVLVSIKKVEKDYRKGKHRMMEAIEKTAINAEKILELYKRPSTDIRAIRLLGLLEMLDYSQCAQTTRARAKKVLNKILGTEKEIEDIQNWK